jgi:hypothetical protein
MAKLLAAVVPVRRMTFLRSLTTTVAVGTVNTVVPEPVVACGCKPRK